MPSKEIFYFKFYPQHYLTGNITICSLEAQGLFVNICCHYWQRKCSLTTKQLQARYGHQQDLINELVENEVIKVVDEGVRIEFLNEQYGVIYERSERARSAANKRWGDKNEEPKDKPKYGKPVSPIAPSVVMYEGKEFKEAVKIDRPWKELMERAGKIDWDKELTEFIIYIEQTQAFPKNYGDLKKYFVNYHNKRVKHAGSNNKKTSLIEQVYRDKGSGTGKED